MTGKRFGEREMTASVDGLLNRRPMVGLAIGVVRDGALEFFRGHGFADVASATPITEDTVFRVASITKTMTAIAAMQLVEQGLLDLDAPANDYLRSYRLLPSEPHFGTVTVRQLMTHTSGIPELAYPSRIFEPLFGEMVEFGRPVPTLREYYQGTLRYTAEPGTRFVYTDHGFATLAQIVEDVSGEPFDRYLRRHIFEPLGMADTDLLRTERVRSKLATGYKLTARGTKPVTDRELITAGGGGAYSTPRDMARYVAALIGGGENEHGSILKPPTLHAMFEPHFRPERRLAGVGLAFWRGEVRGHAFLEHGGIMPGFNSEIVFAPDDGVGVIAFTNGGRLAMLWLGVEASALLEEVIGLPPATIRTDVPQRPERWREFCGSYHPVARATDARARLAVGAGVEVFVRGDRLMLRAVMPIPAVYRGFELHPDDPTDPDIFRVDLSRFGMGLQRVVFTRDPIGEVRAVNLEIIPPPLEKRSNVMNRSIWAVGGVAAATTLGGAAVRRLRQRSSRDR